MRFNKTNNIHDEQLKAAHDILSRYRFSITSKQKQSSLFVDHKHTVEIYDVDEVTATLNKQDRRSALRLLLTALLEEKNYLPVALASKKLIQNIEKLKTKFPNFEVVIDRCVKSLALAMLQRPAIISVPALLLVGPPGIGKTRFLTELAAVLKVDFYKTDFASTSAGFILAGASTIWAEGKPGVITDSLRKSNTANFIMLLDEIDKVSGDSKHDPLGCMYSLLEKKTAKEFIDEALQVKMNCSQINWFASANYLERIPAPILSRFSVFNIESPSYEQQCLIAQSVYEDLIADHQWGIKFEKHLDQSVIEKLVSFSARKQKSALLNACAEVAFRANPKLKARLKIEVSDIKVMEKSKQKRSIGFI